MESSTRVGKSGFRRAQTVRPHPVSARSRVIFENSSSTRDSDPNYESRELLISSNLVGTCPDMCPAKERIQRERLRDLAVFERLNGNPVKTSPSLAVKKFCRTLSSNEVHSSDLRPTLVLQNTLKYLLSLMDSSEHPFEVVHDFVFDRTRSIRQDLSMQNIINEEAIEMYEEMVKFHIISHQKLAKRRSGPDDSSSLHYLNMEQLTKCLLSLYEVYDINRRLQFINKHEMEFHSFYILLHIGYKIPIMKDSLSLWFRHLSSPILHSKEMRFARTLLRYFRMGDYKRFFGILKTEASQLQLCLIEPFLNEARVQAISCINHSGYKLQPYPLEHLSEVLMIKEQELESLCFECGLEVITDELGCKLLPVKQSSFHHPKSDLESYGLTSSDKFHSSLPRPDSSSNLQVNSSHGGKAFF
ncbi:SAC3 family protein C isoform X1 [Dendrobium catenatum]|uniref:SAC3 family protein C isoform X1 n=1 Tax=Dendrobium catenatum TaxID=906689 RepID=UPI0009F660E6|nr:SAC3 family protein C isoform X1 [Dendrobium catenatum]